MAPDFSTHYTRAGDDGFTRVIGKERLPKYDLHLEACGEVDELQAVLGMCRVGSISQTANDVLVVVERDLYAIMAELATTTEPEKRSQLHIGPERVEWLEATTDEIGAQIPPLSDFLLPGDSSSGALLNLARVVARRAERAVARLVHHQSAQGRRDSQPLAYLNRLSSLLFVLVRSEDLRAGVDRPTVAGP